VNHGTFSAIVGWTCAWFSGHALAQDALVPGPDVAVPPPEVVCVDDARSVRSQVEAAFAEIQRIYRTRVAGPAGQRLLETRIDELFERIVDFERFVVLALGAAWERADASQREPWRSTLRATLQQRYLRQLGAPLAAQLMITRVLLRCDQAEVTLVLTDRRRGQHQDVVLELVAVLGEAGVAWRAFDVAVDGVSLLEGWKGRLRRLYEDGGVAAIDQHLRGLRARYGPR